MIATLKTYALAAFGFISAILYGLFKYQKNKADRQEKIIEEQEREAKKEQVVKEITDIFNKELNEEEQLIEEKFDDKEKEAVANIDDKPLSPSLIQLLNSRHKDGSLPPPE